MGLGDCDYRFKNSTLNDLARLINEFASPCHAASTSVGRGRCDDSGDRVYCVSDEDRPFETPVLDSEESDCVNIRRVGTESGEIRETKESVSDRAAKRSFCREFVIDVHRIKVTGQASEVNDIGFRDCTSLALPAVTSL